jgi:hypothetical protein
MKKVLLILLGLSLYILTACTNYSRTPISKSAEAKIPSAKPIYTPKEDLSKKLDVEFLGGYVFNDYVKVKYKIINNSTDHNFKFVEVKVTLLDEDKNVLTSDWTYAVGNEGLSPDEAKEFHIMIDKPSSGRVKYYRNEIIDYD